MPTLVPTNDPAWSQTDHHFRISAYLDIHLFSFERAKCLGVCQTRANGIERRNCIILQESFDEPSPFFLRPNPAFIHPADIDD